MLRSHMNGNVTVQMTLPLSQNGYQIAHVTCRVPAIEHKLAEAGGNLTFTPFKCNTIKNNSLILRPIKSACSNLILILAVND